MRSRSRPGLTVVELLVVIVVIGILFALLMPVLGVLRQRAAKTATITLMRQVADAIFAYDRDGRFQASGAPAAFAAAPVAYLILRSDPSGSPYLQLPVARAGDATGNPSGTWADDSTILDDWGLPLQFAPADYTQAGTGRRWLATASIRSTAGTVSVATDDLVFRYDASENATNPDKAGSGSWYLVQ
jgi:prepilin-type N-terminal cleavage/methylation domain-containing protein